jgi:threonine/homoserine efflux transporter RhtA
MVVFFALVPQLGPPGPHAAAHTALLGLRFNAMATTSWVGYVLAVHRLADGLAAQATVSRHRMSAEGRIRVHGPLTDQGPA